MSEKPYELPLKNVKTPLCFAIKDNYVGNGYYLELVDGDGDMFVLDIETEIIDIISAKFDDILTAVNAYPALVAENAELKNRIKAIETLVKANLFVGNELLLCVSDGRGRHYLSKEILSILHPALEKGGE